VVATSSAISDSRALTSDSGNIVIDQDYSLCGDPGKHTGEVASVHMGDLTSEHLMAA
jgi:hypothetical protein